MFSINKTLAARYIKYAVKKEEINIKDTKDKFVFFLNKFGFT